MKQAFAQKEPYVKNRTKRGFDAQKQMADDSKALMRLSEARLKALSPQEKQAGRPRGPQSIVL